MPDLHILILHCKTNRLRADAGYFPVLNYRVVVFVRDGRARDHHKHTNTHPTLSTNLRRLGSCDQIPHDSSKYT